MGGVEADKLVGEGAVVHQHNVVTGVVLTETAAVQQWEINKIKYCVYDKTKTKGNGIPGLAQEEVDIHQHDHHCVLMHH